MSAREAALTFAGDRDLLVLGFEEDVAGFDARGRAVPRARRRAARERRRRRRLAGRVPARAVPARHVRGDGRAVGDVRDGGHLGPAAGARGVGERRGAEALGGAGSVTCRLTHAYPDGAAPYFTVLAPAERGEEAAQWDAIKAVAGDAVLAAGGTITHHHAVGRDHRRWYDEQRPEPFAAAWRAAKAALDPDGRLNPGVLWEQA